MKVAYFDCFAGASGDMILGALLDAGVKLADVEAELQRLPLTGYRVEVKRVDRCGITATKVDVMVGEQLADREFTEVHTNTTHTHTHGDDHTHTHTTHTHSHGDGHTHTHTHTHAHAHAHGESHTHSHEHRPLSKILALLDGSDLRPAVKDLTKRIFIRLGKAESRVHGMPFEEVHFHEVGGVDAIVDIVGVATGLVLLGADRIAVSPIHVGRGFVKTAHGLYPVPAPATAYLLEGMSVYSTEVQGELITPTGAAILAEVATSHGPLPAMKAQIVGYGAGTKERKIPNVLRLVVGEVAADVASQGPTESVTELMANIDDMNPQFYDHIIERCLAAGALDVWLVPVHMKKNRPGVVLHVLARPAEAEALTGIILAESTTIGVRRQELSRVALEREFVSVETPWGPVNVKVARQAGRVINMAPEYEDCRAVARKHGVPLKAVHAATLRQIQPLVK